jgi:hypothetical protein
LLDFKEDIGLSGKLFSFQKRSKKLLAMAMFWPLIPGIPGTPKSQHQNSEKRSMRGPEAELRGNTNRKVVRLF